MNLLGDLRFGFRTLLKNPGFSAVAVIMLAIGIGVNATVFTVTNAVLFKGFADVARNDRLVYISDGGCCVSYPDFQDYRAQSKSFEGMAIVHGIGIAFSDASGFPERLEVTEVSADTFKVVGQKPMMGRDFTPADEVDGAAPVAILSYGFWDRRYGKDPSVIGRAVRKNGDSMAIVGIMPQGFSFPQKVDLWVPLVRTPTVLRRDRRDTWCVVGRLAEGATFEGARSEIETIAKRLAVAYPDTNRDFRPVVGHFHEFFIGPNATLLYGSMWGAVGFVLLIACANLANLLLARALNRSREISIRMALGAGKWRIVRQVLIESALLSCLGGFLGWWIAKWGVRAFAAAIENKSAWVILDYTMDYRVLAYLIAISIGTGLLFGLAPALQLSRLDINAPLKDGGRGATGGGHGRRLSALLVAGEMALAVVLLAGAGVMIRSFLRIHTANIGADTSNILTGSIDLLAKYPHAEDKMSFYNRLMARMEGMPGVESVAMAESLPSWNVPKRPYQLAGDPEFDQRRGSTLSVMKISPAYFRVVRAPLLSGREFNDADGPAGAPVAIINELFASKFWPGQDPIGKRLRFWDGDKPEAWLTVVGVVSNILQNDDTRQKFAPLVYVPYLQQPGGSAWLVVRTRVSPGGLANAFRQEVQALDADLPVYGPFVLTDRLERYWDSRFYGSVFLIFAAIALLLASVGLYSVVADSIRQRTQEIGIRMAMGATARDVLELVVRQGMLPLGIGLIIGLAASLAVNRLLAAALVQVSPSDPIALAVASATLVLSAALGCFIPARRAMRVDPVVALRHD